MEIKFASEWADKALAQVEEMCDILDRFGEIKKTVDGGAEKIMNIAQKTAAKAFPASDDERRKGWMIFVLNEAIAKLARSMDKSTKDLLEFMLNVETKTLEELAGIKDE